MSAIKIPLVNPCNQQWSSMKDESNGKHCSVCNKTVVDFSGKKEEEIVHYLSSKQEEVCGRFSASQVAIALPYKSQLSSFRKKWIAFVAAISMFLFGKKAWSFSLSNHNQPSNKLQTGLAKKQNTIVHGWIKSAENKKGLSHIEIRIYSGGKTIAYTRSFSNGSYFIDIPENTIIDFTMNIEFSHATMVSRLITDVPAQKNRIACDIALSAIHRIELARTIEIDKSMPIKFEEHMVLGGVGSNVQFIQPHEFLQANVIEEEKSSVKEEMRHASDTVSFEPNPEKIEEFSIKAYPNPTKEFFVVDINNSINSQVFIYDLHGKIIDSRSTIHNREEFSLRDFPSGMYIVNVIDMEKNRSRQTRVIKVN